MHLKIQHMLEFTLRRGSARKRGGWVMSSYLLIAHMKEVTANTAIQQGPGGTSLTKEGKG